MNVNTRPKFGPAAHSRALSLSLQKIEENKSCVKPNPKALTSNLKPQTRVCAEAIENDAVWKTHGNPAPEHRTWNLLVLDGIRRY